MAPHRVTYRPEMNSAADHEKYLQQAQQQQGGKKSSMETETSLNPTASTSSTTFATSPPSLFNYEIFNLNPGSWYELIVRAQTEAGYVSRECYFSTLKMDGSTIAPLTLKATDGGLGSLGRAGADSSSFLSISSNKLAQLHYIVPDSCALFILFLVTVVVCAIHSNHQAKQAMQAASSGLHHSSSLHDHHHNALQGLQQQHQLQHQQQQQQPPHHFLLSFMINRGGHRSDKVVAGSNGGARKTICSNSSNYTSSSGGTTTGSCAGDGLGDRGGKQQQQLMMLLHDSTGNPLTDLSGADFCTAKASLIFEDQGGNNGRYGKPMLNGGRFDNCHSLGGCNALAMVNMETLKMLKQGGSSSKSNPFFSLYNLPVPYATSAVQLAAVSKAGGGGDQCKSAESIYGTTRAAVTTTTAATAHYNKGQLSEMYCDGVGQAGAVGLVMIDGNGGQQLQQQCSANDLHHLQQFQQKQQQQQQQQQQQNLLHLHRGSSGGSHQYELPFVFKCAPNPHNESTAF
ncbi:hypothetical protein TYRP_018279 [Tyrophagus putrescentiae]|nr:hypothetical protein TYRP_018279 [Tyrophagus putrescentiae]